MLWLHWHQWLRPAQALKSRSHCFQHLAQLVGTAVQHHFQLLLVVGSSVLQLLPSIGICLLLLLQQALLELRLGMLLLLHLPAHQLLDLLPMVLAQAELLVLLVVGVLPHVLYVQGVLLSLRRLGAQALQVLVPWP